MTPDGPERRSSYQIFKGKKIVLFGVAGAFTPVCDKSHLPGFLGNIGAFKGRGIDDIAVTSVNDIFVMDAWAKGTGANDKIIFLADGNGDFARALGLSLDLTARGLGIRSQRYAMIVDDGVVRNSTSKRHPARSRPRARKPFLRTFRHLALRWALGPHRDAGGAAPKPADRSKCTKPRARCSKQDVDSIFRIANDGKCREQVPNGAPIRRPDSAPAGHSGIEEHIGCICGSGGGKHAHGDERVNG